MATQTTNYNLTKPAWDEKVDVSVLNTNSDIIDAQMKQNQTSATQAVANMAPTYDATATYETGDFVTYDNKLWVALENIATPEAFDNTKWAETTASENFGSGGGGGGNANERVLTAEEYEALSEAEKMNGTTYYLNDVNYSQLIQPVVYSDDERCIGVWRDGKPLYQKTVAFGSVSSSNSYDITMGLSNVDEVVNISCMARTDNNDWWTSLPRPLYVNNQDFKNYSLDIQGYKQPTDKVNIYTGASINIDKGYVTIRYTKTTDTAGSGAWTPSGIPAVHYSEDEQVVGTWIDGSTLYQKTVEFQNQITVSTSWQATGIVINNIALIVNASGYDKSDKTFYPLNAIIDNGEVKFCTCRPNSSSFIRGCTIQYIKTT